MKSLSVFSSAFNSIKQRYSKVTVTSLGLIAVLLVAYFIFLDSRADKLDQRQLRALTRVQNQLMINLDGFKSLALSKTDAGLKRIFQRQGQGEYITPQDVIQEFNQGVRLDSGNLVLINYDLIDWVPNIAPGGTAYVTHHENADSLFNILLLRPYSNEYTLELDFVISIRSLLHPLLRTDMFDAFVITRNDTIVYESVPTGSRTLEYDTASTDLISLSGNNAIKRVTLNGQPQRVYKVGFSVDAQAGWSIIGLKSQAAFDNEKRTLPRAYLFAVFIIGVFIVLAIPFIKAMIMSRTERLSTLDALFSAISLAVATSLFAILLIDGYLHSEIDNVERNTQLSEMAASVENHLVTEIDAATDELHNFSHYVDSLLDNGLVIPMNSTSNPSIGDTATAGADSTKRDWSILSHDYHTDRYQYSKNMFLVSNEGLSEYDQKEPSTSFNVQKRKYVSALREGQCMSHPGVSSPFYLDAVISWREQRFRGVVSVPLPADTRHSGAAMTAPLRTFNNLILPDDYGFAVFDQKGNVLFHSDSSRCLNENILEECDYDSKFQAAITGRTEASFSTEYSGSWHNFYVKPLGNLPYYVATFARESPIDAIHGQVFGMSFILQILLFSFYIAVILIGISLLRRRSRLHVAAVDLSAFIPEEESREKYLDAFIFNSLHFLLLFTGIWVMDRSLSVVALFFVSAPYTIYLNMVILSKFRLIDFIRSDSGYISRTYMLALIAANVISVFFISMEMTIALIAVQLLTVGLYLLVEGRGKLSEFKSKMYRLFRGWDYQFTYNMVIYVIVLVTCVLPAASFATLSYDKEKELQAKIAQLDVLHDLAMYDHIALVENDSLNKLSAYYEPLFNMSVQPSPEAPSGSKFNSYDAFSSTVRGFIQNSGSKYNRLRYGAEDSLWSWTSGNGQLTLNGRSQSPCKPDFGYLITSDVTKYHVPRHPLDQTGVFLRFWSSLALAILVLFFVLKFFTNKIFVLRKYSRQRSLRFDQNFFDRAEPGYKAFVTGMPSAGKSVYFRNILQQKTKIYVIDFIRHSSTEWTEILELAAMSDDGVIILDHFEHDILNDDLNKNKLELIESLVGEHGKKVIIVSSVQPAVFMNMIASESKVEKKEESARYHERWNRVLASFYNFIFPLQGYERDPHRLSNQVVAALPADVKLAVPGKLVYLIESECDHGEFMRSIGIELLGELHARDEIHKMMDRGRKWKEREEIIIRTQKLSENYYRSLWSHLAVEEQFVLYDLAQDGLVNPKNLDVVETLIDKGIIIYTNKLTIMNRSFRNFILTVVGPSDLGNLDQQMKDTGAWGKIKLPLFMIVCALFLFVMKSDRTALFGYFTAFMAVIPAVVTLFGYFGYANRKE